MHFLGVHTLFYLCVYTNTSQNTHPPTHFLTHSLTHSPTHFLTHSITHPPTQTMDAVTTSSCTNPAVAATAGACMHTRAQIRRVVNTDTGTAHACRRRGTGLTPWRHRNTGIVRAVTCLPAQVIEGLGEGIGEQHVRKEDDGPDEGAHEEEDADGQAHSLALHLNLSKLGVGRQLVRVVILYGGAGQRHHAARAQREHCEHMRAAQQPPGAAGHRTPPLAGRRHRARAAAAGRVRRQRHGGGGGIGGGVAAADAQHVATPTPARCAACGARGGRGRPRSHLLSRRCSVAAERPALQRRRHRAGQRAGSQAPGPRREHGLRDEGVPGYEATGRREGRRGREGAQERHGGEPCP